MSTESEVTEFNDALYSQYIGEPHDIASHRKPRRRKLLSWNRPSIIIDCMIIILIGLLGSFVVESGILMHPPKVEAQDIPLIPALSNTLPAVPPTVDTPRVADEHAARGLQRKPITNVPKSTVVSGQSKVERTIKYALAQQGKRYRWGTTGPNTFDCSGLIVAAYKSIGIVLYHFTGALLKRGIKVSRGSLRRGDLIFPTSSHVGIYLGGNKMIVASSGHGKVMIQTVYSFYTARRLL